MPACDTPITCQNMDPVPQDSDSCLILTEGCVCAEGTILHRAHSALCIPEEKCGGYRSVAMYFFFLHLPTNVMTKYYDPNLLI